MKKKLGSLLAATAMGTLALAAEAPPPQPLDGEEAQAQLLASQKAAEAALSSEAQRFVIEYRATPLLQSREVGASKQLGGGKRLYRSPAPLHTYVAKRNPDGSFSYGCVQHPGELVEFLGTASGSETPDAAQTLKAEEK
jgi:hypothetical protein